MKHPLITRWAAFLDKVTQRLEAIIAEATPGLTALVRAHPDDPLVLSNALTGLDHRVEQLFDKVDSTWDTAVEPKFEAAGDRVWDRGLDMKADAELALRHRWQCARSACLVGLAPEAKARAQASDAEALHCHQCGAPLAVQRRRPVSHPCPACGSVNQVTPTAANRMYYGTFVSFLAEAAELPHRQAIDRFREQVHRTSRAQGWKRESVSSMERWRDMERAAVQAYAERAAELTGDPLDRSGLEARMRAFMRNNLHNEQSWVRKHGRDEA